MDSKNKSIYIAILALGLLAMSIAFAALSTNLRISGTASVPSTTWNIHFQNWSVSETQNEVTVGGVTHANTAVYPQVNELTQLVSVANSTKVEGINVGLKQPGDYVKYTFQIINEGSIDASLDSFEKNLKCASGDDCSHLSYTIECKDSNNNNMLAEHATLAVNQIAYCTLTVTYNDQTNQNQNQPGENQVYTQAAASAELIATWNYIQKIDSSASSGSNIPSSLLTYSYISGNTENALSQDSSGNYWYNDIGNDWVTYLKNDGTTTEVCGKFPDGTVCFVGNSNGYASDFENCSPDQSEPGSSCLTGYTKTIVDLMIANGGACRSRQQYAVCTGNPGNGSVNNCEINPDGYVACDSGDAHVCDSDGSTYSCY